MSFQPSRTVTSKKWQDRSFYLLAPLRTSSAETIPARTSVLTTGKISHSRWFVHVRFSKKRRRSVIKLEFWVRRKDLLNLTLATHDIPDTHAEEIQAALRSIHNFQPLRAS